MKGISVRLIWAGVAATIVMTAIMMFVAPLMGVHMDIAASLAGMMRMPWAVGLVMHMMLGVVAFPVAFAVFAEQVPVSPALRGLIFGTLLWLMMEAAVMPMLGAGFFGVNGPGMMGAAAGLMAHLVYGLILALIAAPRTDAVQIEAKEPRLQVRVTRTGQNSAALKAPDGLHDTGGLRRDA
jgi:hypothetical protein